MCPIVGDMCASVAVEEMVLEMDSAPEAAAIARDHLTRWAARHAPAVQTELRQVVSELVANASRFGPDDEPIALHLRAIGPHRVEGEVVDQGDGHLDVVPRAAADEDGGFGLRIVGELCREWGVRPGSTCVWFALEAVPPSD